MPCVYPIDAWRSDRKNESGKRGITFDIRKAYSDQALQLPCGKCPGCARDRSKTWAVRLHHERSLHDQACFLTLTYDQAHCPTRLCKRDLQLFFKRLRKQTPVRYFACGEYGDRTRRPHYHAIIYGTDFRGGSYRINSELYGNRILDAIWRKGLCAVGDVSIASCCYVAGYVNKKTTDPDTFNLMSRRPGIGHSWLDKYRDDIIRTGQVSIEGSTFPIPKKYLEWYAEDFSKLVSERREHMRKLTPVQVCQRRADLRSRERNLIARAALTKVTL